MGSRAARLPDQGTRRPILPQGLRQQTAYHQVSARQITFQPYQSQMLPAQVNGTPHLEGIEAREETTISAFYECIALLHGLKERGCFSEYAELVMKMFDKGLIVQKDAESKFSAALHGLKENRFRSYYAYFVIKMLDKKLIAQEDAKSKLSKILEESKGKEWGEYADLVIRMFDKGLIVQKDAEPKLSAALHGLKEKGCSSGYADLVIKMFDKMLIAQEDAKSKLGEALEDSKGKEWGEYAYFVIKMLDKGLIVQKDDPGLSAALQGSKENGMWDYYAKLVIKMLDKGLIVQKDDPRLSAALQSLKERGSFSEYADEYADLVVKMLDKELIAQEDAKSKLSEALGDLKGFRVTYADLVTKMIDKDLIVQKDDPRLSVALQGLKGSASAYASLVIKMIDKELIVQKDDPRLSAALQALKEEGWLGYARVVAEMLKKGLIVQKDTEFIKNQNNLAKKRQLDISYSLKLTQLRRWFDLDEEELNKLRNQFKELISLIETTNQNTEREDQKIDFAEIKTYHLHGLANLQTISPKLTKELVSNYCQRGFLPLLAQDIKTASLIEPKWVWAMRESLQGIKENQITPGFLMQIIDFVPAYETLGLGSDLFRQALSASSEEKITFNLARFVIEELARRFNINIDLSVDMNMLENWNLGYLGSMISASSKWSDKDRTLFKLVLRTALEGKFHALLYSEEYPEDFLNYSPAERELIAKIREYNAKFIEQAKRLGINTDNWIHPERIAPKSVSGVKLLRDWQVVFKDFRSIFRKFEEWFSVSSFSERIDFTQHFERAKRPLGPFKRLVEVKENELRLSVGLLNQRNNLNKLFKLLEKIQTEFHSKEPLPEEVADLMNIIKEIKNYDLVKYKVQPKPLQMRFWRRIVGRDAVIANQVESCTRLGINARAIFEYLLDLGTIYLVLEDPNTGQEKGYARFFLALNEKKEPAIFVDSADGKANVGSGNPIKEAEDYIKEFAKAARIKPENVITDRGPIKAKVGDALTRNYFHHSEIDIPEMRRSLPELKEASIMSRIILAIRSFLR